MKSSASIRPMFIAALAIIAAQPASAEQPFDAVAVDDEVLSVIHGRFVPSPPLFTLGNVKNVSDQLVRGDLQLVGSIGRVALDNWWATEGADIIILNTTPR